MYLEEELEDREQSSQEFGRSPETAQKLLIELNVHLMEQLFVAAVNEVLVYLQC